MNSANALRVGKVYLVGAGPGDPGLLTLRGAECLRRAHAVLYDYLANPVLLEHALMAEKICLGHHGHSRVWSQDEIHVELVRRARLGQTVVRLKGGDPAIFARGAEELEVLVREGIPYEVVPGITAALAASSCAGIPVTHREMASAVALVTGQEQSEKSESALDYDALAKFPGTLVFYMGVTTAPHWTRALLEAGKPADTPCAIVRRCSFPDQVTLHTTLDEVAERLKSMRPPIIVIVGAVATMGPAFSWFEKRPLFGKRILVTRPVDQAGTLRDDLTELGAEVFIQPAIEILPPLDWQPLNDAFEELNKFDWLVFSSANGVRYLLDHLLASGQDLRALGKVKLAAIGPATADELLNYHLRADAQPAEDFRAESLAAALAGKAKKKRILLVRASRGREVLAEHLTAAGAQVEQVVAYQSADVTEPHPEIAERLAHGQLDWITVTSSAIARSLVQLFGSQMRRAKLASISPITSATLVELGYPPAAEATEYTMAGVIRAILKHEAET